MLNPERLEQYVNDGQFIIDYSGPLYSPINKIKINRDKNLHFILETTSGLSSNSEAVTHPLGTVRISDESISLTGILGSKVSIKGVQPNGSTTTTSINSESIRKELSSVESIEAELKEISSGKYLIEWLENVDDGRYIWPNSVETCTEKSTITSIGTGSDRIEINMSKKSKAIGRNSISLSIDKNSFYLVTSKSDQSSHGVNSGYILYLGVPSDEERKKIRNCLSFALGRPLIKTGYSIYNSKWELVFFKLISAYSMGGAAFSLPSLPPSPLSTRFTSFIDEKILHSIVNSIYHKYDMYKFGYLSWAYWHAICAPVHIAAVHFGACIESLQKSYIDNNGKVFRSTLIERTEWKLLQKGVLEVLNSLIIDEEDSRVIKNKISSLNQTPQSIMTERFLSNIDINLSYIEKAAWKQRNNAAHGKEIEKDGEILLIREIKILKVIFHRVLLRIMGGTDLYTDYYTIGFPIKKITISIEDNA